MDGDDDDFQLNLVAAPSKPAPSQNAPQVSAGVNKQNVQKKLGQQAKLASVSRSDTVPSANHALPAAQASGHTESASASATAVPAHKVRFAPVETDAVAHAAAANSKATPASATVSATSAKASERPGQPDKQLGSRRNPLKTGGHRTPVIIPVGPAPAGPQSTKFAADAKADDDDDAMDEDAADGGDVAPSAGAASGAAAGAAAGRATAGTAKPAASNTTGASGASPSAAAGSAAANASKSSFRILEYDIDHDGAVMSSLFGAADGKTGAAAFSAMGLDKKLVDKLTTAPGDGKAVGAHAMTTAPGTGGGLIAAVSGVVRGHLRDGFGLARPTRVQKMVLPPAIQGKSLVVKSETGSGKTLAFCLPVVHGLLAQHAVTALTRGAGGTKALIISPTRELCAQIFGVLSRLCQPFPFIIPGLLAGGEKRKSEKARLRKGCTIVVATPGRLLDHLRMTESFHCDDASVRWLVLDEADRLLDMGFGAQVTAIVAELSKRRSKVSAGPATRQTLLVSATVSSAVRELAQSILSSDAVFVDASAAGAAKEAKAKEKEKIAKEGGAADADGAGGADGEEQDEDADGSAEDKPAPKAALQDEAVVFSAPKTLTQIALLVPLKWRLVTLLGLLVQSVRKARVTAAKAAAKRREGQSAGAPKYDRFGASNGEGGQFKAILFLSSTHAVDFHSSLLALVLPRLLGRGKPTGGDDDNNIYRTSFPVYRLHGNVAQSDRTTVYRAFAACESGLLVATDVAARGLDLPAVDMIIQADAPSEKGEYVHRIGRTARRGAKGTAVLLLQPHEAPFLDLLTAAGLSVSRGDTTPPLASLAELKIPMDLAAHPDFKPASGAAAGSAGGTGAGKGPTGPGAKGRGKDGQGGGKDGSAKGLDLEAMIEADPQHAEAAAQAYFSSSLSSRNNASSKRRGEDGGPSGRGEGGEDDEDKDGPSLDPATGAPMRLMHLIRFAEDVKRRAAAGHAPVAGGPSGGGRGHSSAEGLGLGLGGGSLVRTAEAFAVSWQYWLEEVILHRAVDVVGSTGGASTKAGKAGPTAAGGPGGADGAEAGKLSPLLSLARQAFTSFVRAYATHEKSVRHIFHPRSLHLGHCAKAFGLREQPGVASREAGREAARSAQEQEDEEQDTGHKQRKRARDDGDDDVLVHSKGRGRDDDMDDGGHGHGGAAGKKRKEGAGARDADGGKHKRSKLNFAAQALAAPTEEDRPANARGSVAFGSDGAGADPDGGFGQAAQVHAAAKKQGTAKAKPKSYSEFDS